MERKVYIISRSILLIFVSAFVLFSVSVAVFSRLGSLPSDKNIDDNFSQQQDNTVINDEEENDEESTIDIITPQSNEVVINPITILGKAKGWYFEGVFSAKLLDDNGEEIGQGQMKAKEDWMQNKFVPFEGKIEFSKPATKGGKIIFTKNNPSGLPENDEKVEFSVLFSK